MSGMLAASWEEIAAWHHSFVTSDIVSVKIVNDISFLFRRDSSAGISCYDVFSRKVASLFSF